MRWKKESSNEALSLLYSVRKSSQKIKGGLNGPLCDSLVPLKLQTRQAFLRNTKSVTPCLVTALSVETGP